MNNSSNLYDLIEVILEENFGKNDVAKIGKDLCCNGSSTIIEIIKRLKMDYITIRNPLIILMQNKIVSFEEKSRKKELNVPNIQLDEAKEIFYEFDTENCLMRLKFPKMLYNIKAIYGDIGQMIFEEFMMFGVMNSFQCIETVYDKLKMTKKSELNNIKVTFLKMIENNYLTQSTHIKFKENYYEEKSNLDFFKKIRKREKIEKKEEKRRNRSKNGFRSK